MDSKRIQLISEIDLLFYTLCFQIFQINFNQ